MNIPAQLKYTTDHEWVRIEGDMAFIGITDYAQGELVNNDPYGEGWIIKVKMADPAKVETLMDAAAYSSFLG